MGLHRRGKWTEVRTRESGAVLRDVRPMMAEARSADIETMVGG